MNDGTRLAVTAPHSEVLPEARGGTVLSGATALALPARCSTRLVDAIMRGANNGLVLIDADTLRFAEFNDHACAMHGYSRDEFALMTLPDISVCMTEDQIRESHESYAAERDPFGAVTVEHRHRDGSVMTVRADFRITELNGRLYSVTFWTDETAEAATREKLAEREKIFSLIVANTADSLVMVDIDTLRLVEFNDVACHDLGYTRTEFAALTLADIRAAHDSDALRAMLRSAAASDRESFEMREQHVRKDGGIIDVSVRFRFAKLRGRTFAVSSSNNITARLAEERVLLESEQRFRTLVENSPDAIVRYDRNFRRVYANPAYERLTWRPVADAVGSSVCDDATFASREHYLATLCQVFTTATEQTIEYHLRRADGQMRWTHVRLAPEIAIDAAGQHAVTHILAIIRDIQELVDQRDEVRRLAETDTLTGLPNRAHFNRALSALVDQSQRDGRRFALTVFDLDHFKDVNDGLGHGAGDRLLVMVAERLRAVVPEGADLARLGGDEFSVKLPDFHDPAVVIALSDSILQQLAHPFLVDGKRIFITGSIGTAIFPDDGDTPDTLVASADAAMYDAKRQGRNNHQFYLNELVKQASDRLSVIAALHTAISRREFELYYQPQVRMTDGRLIGAEALIRWNHPIEGQIPPGRFIPIAEETGLIIEIGRWAVNEAAAAAAIWNTGRRDPITVAVNLSSRQFLHHDLVATVRDALERNACDGNWLELEITESLMLDDHPAIQDALTGMRALGCRIAIDDFGTGHSALGYLDRFPVDTLKVDRSFVARVVEDPRKTELVRAFVAVAQALGIKPVAEGVETEDQARKLTSFGCIIGQGFLYGRPEPAEQMTRRLFERDVISRRARRA